MPGDVARHLSGQAKLSAHVSIGFTLQALLIARLAMGKRVAADKIQCIPVGQLSLPQGGELDRRQLQFQFGSKSSVHRNILACSSVNVKSEEGAIPLHPRKRDENPD